MSRSFFIFSSNGVKAGVSEGNLSTATAAVIRHCSGSFEVFATVEFFDFGTEIQHLLQVKKITSTNPETPKDQLFISNCFQLPSDWLSQ